MEANFGPLIILITIWSIFGCIYFTWRKIVQNRSCGIFLQPLKENIKGDHLYIVGVHSNQILREVPECDITLVILSATAKHQVTIKNKRKILRRLGTTLIISSSPVCLGDIESISLAINGNVSQWRLQWLKVMDVEHSLMWHFPVPGGNIVAENYIVYSLKGHPESTFKVTKFHNWFLIFFPHRINSYVGILTLLCLILSVVLIAEAVTVLVSTLSFSKMETIWICLVVCLICVIANAIIDIILHLSDLPKDGDKGIKYVCCYYDEWVTAANPNAAITAEFKFSDAISSTTVTDKMLQSKQRLSIRKEGIQVIRQIPVEDFAILQPTYSDDFNWPTIVNARQLKMQPRPPSKLKAPVVHRSLDLAHKKRTWHPSSIAGFLKSHNKYSSKSPSPPSPSPPNQILEATSKPPDLNLPNPDQLPEKSNVASPTYSYVYAFSSKMSLFAISEPLIQLTSKDDAAFVRIDIPTSDVNTSSKLSSSQAVSSSEMLIQDSTGTIWIPKPISPLEKKQSLISFFRHWLSIVDHLQIVDNKLGSLHSSMQTMLVTNESIIVERIRLEILRLVIIFQIKKKETSQTRRPGKKTQSVPKQTANRGTSIFTVRKDHPIIDDYFRSVNVYLTNFIIQLAMIVIYSMKNFVVAAKSHLLDLPGTVLYDLQTVVKYFVRELQGLHDYGQLRLSGQSLFIGDRQMNDPDSLISPVESTTSTTPSLTPSSQKRTQSLQDSLPVDHDQASSSYHFSDSDVPYELEEPNVHALSVEVLPDISKFVDAIIQTIQGVLVKETTGSSLFDFIVCRSLDVDKHCRYCCFEFILLLITSLSQCVVGCVANIVGVELHLHARNLLLSDLRRVVTFATEPVSDACDVLSPRQNYRVYLFPINEEDDGPIEMVFRECVLKNSYPPLKIRSKTELENYKCDLWLLKLVDDFIKHEWLVRSTTPILQLVSSAVPMLHNKIYVGRKILDAILQLIEKFEEHELNQADTESNFHDKPEYFTVLKSIHKRLNNVLKEIQLSFEDLDKIYQKRMLSVAEREYVHQLVNAGLLRNLNSQCSTVMFSLEDLTSDFKMMPNLTYSQLISIRGSILNLHNPKLSANWNKTARAFLFFIIFSTTVVVLTCGFISTASLELILPAIAVTIAVDILFVQTVKSFVLSVYS